MKEESLVSVIITTYNREKEVSRAIKSVLDQSHRNIEVLVVDDASTDNTQSVVESYIKDDPRVKYFCLEKNSGGAAAPKNLGISKARGFFIATLDSDDEWSRDKIKKQLQRLTQTDQKIGFGTCNYIEKNSSAEREVKIPEAKDSFKKILASDYLGPGSSMFYKREVFNEVGVFDENLNSCQDWDMRIRLVQQYDFQIIKEPLVIYNVHGNNISIHTVTEKRERDALYLFKKHENLYKKNPKALALYCRSRGTWYALNKERKKSIRNYMKSIKANWLDAKTYILLFCILFGYGFFNFVQKIQRKLSMV